MPLRNKIKLNNNKGKVKKIILKVTLVLAIGLTHSCGNQTKEKDDHKKIEKIEDSDEHLHSESSGLVLDNGKLWIANPETTAGIENMINTMNSFKEKDNINAYGELMENLKMEFSMIFQKCTMSGEAHNQLHNFLVPIKDLFETLSSTDLKQCQASYDKLNNDLKVYKKYFK